jgi:FKBP-type peptidyl-prolyl cis-trans isomerase (trigger factor)
MSDNTEQDVPDALLADIFKQLLESDRFQQFFEVNYDVKKIVNDEEKSITYMVVEVPPSVVMERLAGKQKAISDEKPKVEVVSPTIQLATELPKNLKN